MTRALAPILLFCATACESDPEPATVVDGFDPRLRGIYTLESHLVNTGACEPGTESAATTEPLFVIDTIDFHGRYWLGALSCPDAATCRAHIEAAQAPLPDDEIPALDVTFFFMFSTSKSDGSASSSSEASQLLPDQTCSARLFSDQLTHAGGNVRIESRITNLPAFAPNPGGTCSVPEAHGQPCNAFELVTGVWSEEL